MSQRKMTADQAQALRQDRATGASVSDLAAKYGVCRQTVCDIVHGKIYQDVDGPTYAPRPRLAPADVVELREAHARGASRDSLAAQYGISHNTVWDVLTGASWANVGGPLAPRRVRTTAQPDVDEVDDIAVERALEDIVCDVPLSVRLTRAERDEVIRMVPDGRREVARTRLKVNITEWRRAMAGAA